jgi:sulfate permease, SulP family
MAGARTSAAIAVTHGIPSRAIRVGHQLAGGVVVAIVALALGLSFGLIAFASLGLGFRDHAVAAGIIASIVGLGIGALFDRSGRTLYGPRSSSTLLLASLVVAVAADPSLPRGDPALAAAFVLGITGLAVLLSGLLMALFALTGVARLARYVPYPFLAGFMCGIAGLIVLRQLPVMVGATSVDFGSPLAFAASLDMGAALVGVGTLLAIVAVGRWWPRLPALALGLGAGVAAYLALAGVAPGMEFGPAVSEMHRAPALLFTPTLLADAAFRSFALRHADVLLATVALLASIGALDGLLTTVAVDSLTGGDRDSSRELLRHGAANIVCGLVGALPVAMSVNYVAAGWRSHARTRWPGVVGATLLALLLLRGEALLRAIPQAVLAGVMLAIAASLVDRWTQAMVVRLRARHRRRDPALVLSMAVVVAVALTTMFTTMLTAVIVGLLLSAALVLSSMHDRLVRNVVTAQARPSRRVWPATALEAVARERARIRIVELEGALFFGSAERLASLAEQLAAEAGWIIVDFDRVSTIDATGALLLDRLAARLASRNCRLLLAGVSRQGRHGKALRGYGAFAQMRGAPWFDDVDRAVEHAESAAVAAAGQADGEALTLAQTDLAAGLDAAGLARLEAAVERVELPAGTTLFRELDPGDRLYTLLRGAITITITLAGGGTSRIATFAPGAVLGEAALLDGRPRSGTAVAAADCTVCVLSRDAIDRLRGSDPALVTHVFANLARMLSLRLRTTTDALRRLEDGRG